MNGYMLPRTCHDPLPVAATVDNLTHVELIWVEKKIERWIRFGHAAYDQVLDRQRRKLSFRPDAIFAFVRWTSNDYGTIVSRLDIVRAVWPHEPYQTLPFVQPGGDVLLKVDGWPQVERMLHMIDAIKRLGIDPADVAPQHWRHIHNRIAAGEPPRAYTLGQHQAFLLRRRTGL